MVVRKHENNYIPLTNMATTNTIQGILISNASVTFIDRRIAEICDWAKAHHAANANEEIALVRTYCRKIIDMLNDCFVEGVYAVEKTKRRLKSHIDNVNENLAGLVQYDAASVLMDIRSMLPNAVSFADMPSCKPFMELTEPEQWLLMKSRAERAYCYQLLVKHGLTISKDIVEIMKNADMEDDIQKYESLPPMNVNLIQS